MFVVGESGFDLATEHDGPPGYLRDVSLPRTLAALEDREETSKEYGRRGAEAARQSKQELFGVQNSLKSLRGRLAGLQDPALIERKATQEARAPSPDRGRPAQGRGVRSGLGPDRRHVRRRPANREADRVPRGRGRLRLRVVLDRPDDRPARRGGHQAQRRAAPRVRRCRPRLARAVALLAGADLRRVRRGQARPLAGVLATARWASRIRPSPASSPAARPRMRPASWCAVPGWPTPRSARSWSRAAARPSRHRTTR